MSTPSWVLAAVLGVALGHSSARADGGVDLNSAPAAELQMLPGIGPKKAAAIIALREKRPFMRVSQLLEVRGIGRKTLDRLKPLVRIGDTSLSHPAAVGVPTLRVEAKPGSMAAVAPP